MTNSKSKINIPMTLACILLCLTMISIYLTGGLYAKYTGAVINEDSARVIKFGDLTLTEVLSVPDSSNIMIIPGADIQKKATVDFGGSEADTYVFVTARLSKNWHADDDTNPKSFYIPMPANSDSQAKAMSFDIAADWFFLKADAESETASYIYFIKLGSNLKLEGKDIIKDGVVKVSDRITRSQIDLLSGISITFSAAAVQANGFTDAETAWQSLSNNT